jgi:hypothetical protein
VIRIVEFQIGFEFKIVYICKKVENRKGISFPSKPLGSFSQPAQPLLFSFLFFFSPPQPICLGLAGLLPAQQQLTRLAYHLT